MIDRRRFIAASLALGVLPVPRLVAAAPRDDGDLRVVVDGACGDARCFSAQCVVNVDGSSDPLQVVSSIATADVQRCFGFGRDSQFFVIAQMAEAEGFRVGYHGIHDYRDGALHHRLRGAREILDTLVPQLRSAGAAWAAPLARSVPALAKDARRDAERELRIATARPTDGAGYLVSWCLHRA